jgi:hypothetical protein
MALAVEAVGGTYHNYKAVRKERRVSRRNAVITHWVNANGLQAQQGLNSVWVSATPQTGSNASGITVNFRLDTVWQRFPGQHFVFRVPISQDSFHDIGGREGSKLGDPCHSPTVEQIAKPRREKSRESEKHSDACRRLVAHLKQFS